MPDTELEQHLKSLLDIFLTGVQLDSQYLIKSQLELNTILEMCITKAENINQSASVSQQKCDLINDRLSRIPKLQSRIEALSRLFYDAHKRIEGIRRDIANLEKIQMLEEGIKKEGKEAKDKEGNEE